MTTAATTDTTTYVEPSQRAAIFEWSPELIRQAEILADSGSLRLAADLCDAMLGDDAVQAGIGSCADALLSCDLSFEEGAGRRKRAAVKAIEADEDWWRAYPEDQLTELIKWGSLLNVGFTPNRWALDPDSGRVLAKIDVWHPRNLTRDLQKRCWKIATGDGGAQVNVVDGDGAWIFFHPRGSKRPWMSGAWRAVARWWLLKRYAIVDWGQYSERHGQGTMVGTGTDKSTKDDRAKLVQDLKRLGRNSAIALPPGYDLKLIEATANTWQTFQAQIAAADKGITVALTSLNVTNESGGSYAKAESLGGIRAQVVKGFGERLATAIHDQSLVFWAEFNFGDRKLAPWPAWDTDPPEDLNQKAETLANVGTFVVAMSAVTNRIDVPALLEQYGVPLLTEAQAGPMPEPQAIPSPEDEEEDEPTGEDDPDDPPKEDGEEAPPPPKKVKKALVTRASATSANRAGQTYIDAVTAKAVARATRLLVSDVEAVRKAVDGATSLEDMRDRIKSAFKNMDPKKLAKLTTRATIMANLAGRAAIQQSR